MQKRGINQLGFSAYFEPYDQPSQSWPVFYINQFSRVLLPFFSLPHYFQPWMTFAVMSQMILNDIEEFLHWVMHKPFSVIQDHLRRHHESHSRLEVAGGGTEKR